MLRFLGKVENVVRFQKFCGLSWDENAASGVDWKQKKESKDSKRFSSTSSDEGKDSAYNSHNSSEDSSSDHELPTDFKNTQPVKYTYNSFLHNIFFFGAELGNEIFYITFLPFVYWNVDDYIARRLIMLWVFNMYAGQGLKDVLCWPRPRSPPVLRLETNYAAEYGMPSTHAIAGSIIPFGLVYFSYGRFEYPLLFGLLFFVAWTSLVCLSRIYLGMHTFQDIVAGLSMAAFVTALWLPYLDGTLEIFLSSANAWIFIMLVPILMIYAFPTKSMVTRNDTATIIAVGCGCMLASWNEYYIDQIPLPNPYGEPVKLMFGTGFIAWILFSATRFIMGVAILISIKIIIKATMKTIANFFESPEISNKKTTERGANQMFTLPYIFTCYGAIGYAAAYIAPKAFEFVGLIH
eukprot:TCONS_00050657-protein